MVSLILEEIMKLTPSHHICKIHDEMYDFVNDHVIRDMPELINFIVNNIILLLEGIIDGFAKIAPHKVYLLYDIE